MKVSNCSTRHGCGPYSWVHHDHHDPRLDQSPRVIVDGPKIIPLTTSVTLPQKKKPPRYFSLKKCCNVKGSVSWKIRNLIVWGNPIKHQILPVEGWHWNTAENAEKHSEQQTLLNNFWKTGDFSGDHQLTVTPLFRCIFSFTYVVL